MNVASRAHDEDDEEEEEHTSKKTVEAEKEDSSVESDEATTLAGRLAEFDPTVFDSVSTPAGTHLQFDENQQSIDRPSTEANEQTTEKAIEEEKKEKRLTLVQLNQGSTLLLFILAALLFSACLLASTLAFVSRSDGTELRAETRDIFFFFFDDEIESKCTRFLLLFPGQNSSLIEEKKSNH